MLSNIGGSQLQKQLIQSVKIDELESEGSEEIFQDQVRDISCDRSINQEDSDENDFQVNAAV